MPVYVYKREDTGETFEIEQSILSPTLDRVFDPFINSWVQVRRVPQSPAIRLVGKGFYRTGG